MTAVQILVTGRGSIAQRHVGNLRALRPEARIAVLSGGEPGQELQPCVWLHDWAEAAAWGPDAVIIADVSSKHAWQLAAALGLGQPCLVEKPLVVTRAELAQIAGACARAQASSRCVVGCNLRYLPSLQIAARRLQAGDVGAVVRASFEVGQDLRRWRPHRELAQTYSARSELGGGVVFDLVHEIDLARWLLGPLRVTAALAGRLGEVALQADDVHVGLLALANGAPVTISMDYVSVQLVRRFTIVGQRGTLEWDLPGSRLCLKTGGQTEILTQDAGDFDVQATYVAEMQDWLQSLDSGRRPLSSLEDGLQSAHLMLDMAEAA